MKQLFLICALSISAWSQTTVYLRSSAPAAQSIVNATNATPIVWTAAQPHGFPGTCTTSTPCYCAVEAVPTGTGSSPANGIRECVYQDPTHLSLYDMTGSPVAGTGDWSLGYVFYPN